MAAKKKSRKQGRSKKTSGKKFARPKKTIKTKAPDKKVKAKPAPKRRRPPPTTFSKSRGGGTLEAGQAGDLQDLSRAERADSESVDELLEEGNAFEAGIVEGVEEADNQEGREVHTHEVPEDDVPEEYLDKDE